MFQVMSKKRNKKKENTLIGYSVGYESLQPLLSLICSYIQNTLTFIKPDGYGERHFVTITKIHKQFNSLAIFKYT